MTLLRLTPAVATHRGMRRRLNEDAVGYEYPNDGSLLLSHGALFMVADGVGGLSSGDKASQMAIENLSKHYYRSDVSKGIAEGLSRAIQQANTDVFLEFDRQGATTLVAVVIHGNQMFSASVGDSQIFSIINESITQLNDEDIMRSNDIEYGALTKAIGYRETLKLTVSQHSLQTNQKILLCSDGLTRYIDTQQLASLAQMRDPRDAVRRMINVANTAGGADNVSALLVHVGETMPIEDLKQHLDSISIRVAVDTDPMIMQDVPSKPQTQIPLSRPETIIDEILLGEPELQVSVSKDEKISQASPNIPAEANKTIVIIITAIAILLLGAVIFGFALASLGNDTNSTSSEATDSTTLPVDTSLIEVGDVILIENVILTKNNIGSDVGAFLTSLNTPYLVENVTTDSTGQLWYLLLEQDTQQTGWLAESELPAYTIYSN